MLSFFRKKKEQTVTTKPDFVHTDMHSHLLPGLDDGAESLEESTVMLKRFVELGYKKAILTPHIMGDSYRNTPNVIREKLHVLEPVAKELGIQIGAAAEYYIDESFYNKLIFGEEILSFGSKRYVLMETSYINEASYLTHVCFELQSKGYMPVLAHPERYTYLYNNLKMYETLIDRGLLFQVNINSLTGY